MKKRNLSQVLAEEFKIAIETNNVNPPLPLQANSRSNNCFDPAAVNRYANSKILAKVRKKQLC
jgi:hypothetical protein